VPLAEGIDWVCVSPKADTNIIVTKGDELKLVYPQKENSPESFLHLDFAHFYLQPLDDSCQASNTEQCIAYCLKHPQWQLSVQTHKYLGID
ncbi:MAG: 7-carboxy-7-deazaguanine synthase, partial [Saprospiraceae bacterium]